jgi:hypothetical protein
MTLQFNAAPLPAAAILRAAPPLAPRAEIRIDDERRGDGPARFAKTSERLRAGRALAGVWRSSPRSGARVEGEVKNRLSGDRRRRRPLRGRPRVRFPLAHDRLQPNNEFLAPAAARGSCLSEPGQTIAIAPRGA